LTKSHVIASLFLGLLFVWTGIDTARGDLETAESHGDIVAEIVGIDAQRGGTLVVALYRGTDGWLKLDKAVQKKTTRADSGSVNVTFDRLPHGNYAVQVFHDQNDNGKIDFRWFPFPKPKEGVGVSNNTRRKGKPRYEEAEFTLEEDVVTRRIEMRY
jgi:uncharacterized protein (DUF2141 family)